MSKDIGKENEQINPSFENEIINIQEKVGENSLNKNISGPIEKSSTKMITNEDLKLTKKKRNKKNKKINKKKTSSKTQKTVSDACTQTMSNFTLDEEDPEEENRITIKK